MIPNTRQIFYPATPNQYDRVLLKVVTLSRDVGDHFVPVGQTHLCDLPQRRVRLFRCARHHPNTNSAPLRAIGEGRGDSVHRHLPATPYDELVDGWHVTKLGPHRSEIKKAAL